jgi:hypothetical protein
VTGEGLENWAGRGISLFATISRVAVGQMQLHKPCTSRPKLETDHSFPSNTRLRMREILPPLHEVVLDNFMFTFNT